MRRRSVTFEGFDYVLDFDVISGWKFDRRFRKSPIFHFTYAAVVKELFPVCHELRHIPTIRMIGASVSLIFSSERRFQR